jgi:hypothetical protein
MEEQKAAVIFYRGGRTYPRIRLPVLGEDTDHDLDVSDPELASSYEERCGVIDAVAAGFPSLVANAWIYDFKWNENLSSNPQDSDNDIGVASQLKVLSMLRARKIFHEELMKPDALRMSIADNGFMVEAGSNVVLDMLSSVLGFSHTGGMWGVDPGIKVRTSAMGEICALIKHMGDIPTNDSLEEWVISVPLVSTFSSLLFATTQVSSNELCITPKLYEVDEYGRVLIRFKGPLAFTVIHERLNKKEM